MLQLRRYYFWVKIGLQSQIIDMQKVPTINFDDLFKDDSWVTVKVGDRLNLCFIRILINISFFCTFIFSGLTKTQWSIIIMYWKPPPPQENKIVENKENPTKNNLKKKQLKINFSYCYNQWH